MRGEMPLFIMITTVILTYNNENTLPRTIVSALKHSTRVIVVDGACKDYEYDKPYSTDATLDIAGSYPKVEIVTTERFYNTEAEKRNIYLDLLTDGDLFLSLDSDETLEDLDTERLDDKSLISYLRLELPNQRLSAPRLICYKHSMSYQTHHILNHKGDYYNLADTRVNLETVGNITQQKSEKTDAYFRCKTKQRRQERAVLKSLHQKGVQLL